MDMSSLPKLLFTTVFLFTACGPDDEPIHKKNVPKPTKVSLYDIPESVVTLKAQTNELFDEARERIQNNFIDQSSAQNKNLFSDDEMEEIRKFFAPINERFINWQEHNKDKRIDYNALKTYCEPLAKSMAREHIVTSLVNLSEFFGVNPSIEDIWNTFYLESTMIDLKKEWNADFAHFYLRPQNDGSIYTIYISYKNFDLFGKQFWNFDRCKKYIMKWKDCFTDGTEKNQQLRPLLFELSKATNQKRIEALGEKIFYLLG